MTKDETSTLTLEDLESKSIHRLVELSHEELEDFIEQAIEIERSTALLTKWLKGIKAIKSRREELIEAQKRGEL